MKQKSGLQLNIRLVFILVALLEIMGTLGAASLLTYLLEDVLKINVELHPAVWLAIFSVGIGVAVTVVVNVLLLRPIVRMNRAMKQVASGDFTVRLESNSFVREVQDSCSSFNTMVSELGNTETLQSDFVSNVSHEFKTPINAIEGYATLLQGAQAKEEQDTYVERILMNTQRLSTLVGNILLLSKVSNHTIPMAKAPYRLDEQIRQVLLQMESRWTEKEIEFDVDLDSVTINANENLLYHVWSNLLSNAVKFTPEGGLITMRLTAEGEYIDFVIEDNGPGIPEAAMEKIFHRFYQLDGTHRQEGNGLGLALCKQILDTCSGSVKVENLPTQGCRFTVRLPK